MNRKLKKQHLFELDIFLQLLVGLTVTSDQFIVSLLKSINFSEVESDSASSSIQQPHTSLYWGSD